MMHVAVLGALLLGQTSGVISTSQPCLRLAVPSYFRPGPSWAAMLELPSPPALAVLNPASGAGAAPDAAYAQASEAARARGIAVLGYVRTRYGARPAAEVLDEVARYRSWYAVDGVFVDEVTAGAEGVDYYAGLVAAMRAGGGTEIVLNPGTVPEEPYMALGDRVVVFEGTADDYASFSAPSWARRYAPRRFWSIVYAVGDPEQQARAVARARAHGVGLLWMTDDADANPYDSFPAIPLRVPGVCR